MTRTLQNRYLPLLIGAVLVPAGFTASQDGGRQPPRQPPVARQGSQDPLRGQPLEDTAAQETARMEAELAQLQGASAELDDRMQRAREFLRDLDEQLRNARLRNAPEEEMKPVSEERQRAETELRQITEQRDLMQRQVQDMETRYAQFKAQIAQQEEDRQRVQREQNLSETEKRRAEAQQAAEAVYRDALMLAEQPDAAKALHEALVQSDLQQLQARYAGLQQRLAELEQLYRQGAVSQSELTETKTQADVILAEMRGATIRGLLQQVEGERSSFEARNKATDVTGEVLQTEFFRGYLDTVQRYSALSRDPADAAVAAVVTAADLLRQKGPQASIDYFEPILEELSRASDPASGAAEAAVRMQLAEAYHAAGQDADALNVLRTLIVRGGTADKAPQ